MCFEKRGVSFVGMNEKVWMGKGVYFGRFSFWCKGFC